MRDLAEFCNPDTCWIYEYIAWEYIQDVEVKDSKGMISSPILTDEQHLFTLRLVS